MDYRMQERMMMDYHVHQPEAFTLTPAELDVASSERAGTVHRRQAIAHVEKCKDLGYLSGDEAGKRVNYLETAQTRQQISSVLRDLPGHEVKKKYLAWQNRKVFIPVLLTTAFTGIWWFVLGEILAKPHMTGPDKVAVTIMMIVGVLEFFGSAVTLLMKLEKS